MILSGRNRNPKQELTHLDIGSVEKKMFFYRSWAFCCVLGFLVCFVGLVFKKTVIPCSFLLNLSR